MQSESSESSSTPKYLFPLGQIVATPAALEELRSHRILAGTLIYRHVAGDWGELEEHDVHQNQFAIRAKLRILSSYKLSETSKVWIITEADRSSTTILLPEEY